MSPHANTWDIHVFRSLNRLKLVKAVLLRYTYPSKDRQFFLKTLLVSLKEDVVYKRANVVIT